MSIAHAPADGAALRERSGFARWEPVAAALCLAQFSEPLFAAIAQSQGATEPPGHARLFFLPVYAFLAWVLWRDRARGTASSLARQAGLPFGACYRELQAMAAAGRREVRDLVALVMMHDTILPLGAVIWAVVDKAPGFTPEGLIAEIRRNAHYPAAEWRAVLTEEPLDPYAMVARLRAALDEAEAFVTRMPTDKMGLLFLQGGKVGQPDPDHLEAYTTHAGQRRGQWSTSPEITAAMFEHCSKRPGSS